MSTSSSYYPMDTTQNILGSIYDKNTWTDLNDFVLDGATASIVSGAIRLSDTSPSIEFDKTLNLNSFTCLDYWNISITFKVISTPSSTTFGLGVGMRPYVDGASVATGMIDLSTGANAGKLQYYDIDLGGTSTSNITFSTGDTIILTTEKIGDTMKVSAYNATTKSTVISLYNIITYPFVNVQNFYQTTGSFAIFSLGGTYDILNINILSKEITNADVMLIGDSKICGFQCSNVNNRLSNILKRDYVSTIISSGLGDTTQGVVLRLPEILSLRPKQVLLCIGSNDTDQVGYAVNYKQISDTLLAAGISVFYCLPFFETARDLSWQVPFINSNFPANRIIDTWTITQLNGVLYVDGIHLTDLGNRLVYSKIIEFGKLQNYVGRIDKVGAPNEVLYYNQSNVTSNSPLFTFDDILSILSLNGSLALSTNTPVTPIDGTIWYDGTNFKARIGGVTKTFTLT